jgi:hypothetical protein
MPFGLHNVSQSFVDQVLGVLDFPFVYLDDILVVSTNLEEKFLHLCAVLQRLRKIRYAPEYEKMPVGSRLR